MQRLLFLICLLGTLRCDGTAFADGNILMAVKGARDITIDTTTVTFPTPSDADLDAGYVEAIGSVTITVDTNTHWGLDLSTTDTDLGSLGGHVKPLSDLQWKRSVDSTWITYSQTAARIQSDNRKANGLQIPLDFRVNLGWITDSPGAFSTTITLTIGGQ